MRRLPYHTERSLELDADNDNARARVAWIREGLAARADPPRLPVAVLEGFAGGYGPIAVALEGEALRATVEGRPGTFTLVPLATDTFDVESPAGAAQPAARSRT